MQEEKCSPNPAFDVRLLRGKLSGDDAKERQRSDARAMCVCVRHGKKRHDMSRESADTGTGVCLPSGTNVEHRVNKRTMRNKATKIGV